MESIDITGNPEKYGSKKKTTLKVCLVALFAALIAGGTFIAIPIGPVPIVLQNLFTLLAGLVLGPFLGSAAVALYLLAGFLGAPVFSGFTGGITRLFGPTGGFFVGYFIMALTAGLIARVPGKKISLPRLIAATAAGMLINYIPGVIWLKIWSGSGWGKALMTGFVPFLIGDTLKGIGAVLIAPRLRKTVAQHLDG